MAVVDSLVFKDEGKPSFIQNPVQDGVKFCAFCNAWHKARSLDNGTEFCAFCNTTHHSEACRVGLRDKCPDPIVDPIHQFLEEECSRHQKFDLGFCPECNCFHSKPAWLVCLTNNKPLLSWSPTRRMLWNLRWEACNSRQEMPSIKLQRSIFNAEELVRIVPHKYPYSNAKFVHHCNV